MSLDTMQVPLIAFLAVVVSNALVIWYLIYARTPTSVPSGPAVARPPVAQPAPAPDQPSGPAAPQPTGPQPDQPQQPGPQQPAPPVQQPAAPITAGTDFNVCLALVLKYEGGNDDDPRDPGGRTSRGILQTEWDTWKQTHAGLPSDVWQAPQDQVTEIYREQYWNALYCDSLPPGVDLAVFDYGVNSGIDRSAKLLQTLTGADVDGEVGPDTIGAAAKADPVSLVSRFCDARLAFLQGLGTWGTFGKGWTSRVQDVRTHALAMASAAPQPKLPTLPQGPNIPVAATGAPPWLTLARSLIGTRAGGDNPIIMAWPKAIAAKYPDMADYAARYVHDSIAWCGVFIAYCLAMNGHRPVFGLTDIGEWMFANAWTQYGITVAEEINGVLVFSSGMSVQPGDILVFQWPSGEHHVSFYDHEDDTDEDYHCTGGNQGRGHVVSTEAMPMESCIAIRRPPAA